MKIGIIGRTADKQAMYDGQTVSTRLWRDELKKHGGSVFVVDTYNYKRRVFPILLQWIWCMFTCTHIVVMLSGGGLSFFLPLLYYANKLFRRKIYHRVIGGELDAYVKEHPKSVKYLNSFEVNWVQSNKMIERLDAVGVKNGKFMENFRNIKAIPESQLRKETEKPYRFCTFSRVSESKGIGLAMETIAKVNAYMGMKVAVLDIYGPIEEAYREQFEALLKKHDDCVEYKGSVPSEQAVGVLKNYFFHLFPTTWKGEGFPGTMLDCYHAGLPTIASTWAYNDEFVQEEKTGYLYPWDKPEELFHCILKAIKQEELVYSMRLNCLNEASKFQPEIAMKKVMSMMNE